MKRLDADERAKIKEDGCPDCAGDTKEEDIDSMQPGGVWQIQCVEGDWAAWAPEM